MLRVVAFAIVSLGLTATVQAQIISNPVLTSWTPFSTAPRYAIPSPVVPAPCCAPAPAPSCGSCATTTRYVPSVAANSVRYYTPTVRAYSPAVTYSAPSVSYRIPVTGPTTVYRTTGAYMPSRPSYSSYPGTPTTSYYYPAAGSARSSLAIPATPSRGCNCHGG